ncbi:ester cyclase [Dyadobacter crusticola]|uniref:ester cyclase n=1 Tax=Dyadobacter crusticola TaxID=292407 RepID=UPI00068D48A7|nr:ester cyclase [Dyadobacter crusticola]
MEISDIKRVAENYMQVWDSGKDGLLEKWACKDLIVEYTHFEKPLNGIEQYRKILIQSYLSFPDITISVDEINAIQDKAIVKWKYTGTHKNDVLFGVAPEGKRVTVTGISILDFCNDRVSREYGIVDNLSLVLQLGALRM